MPGFSHENNFNLPFWIALLGYLKEWLLKSAQVLDELTT